MNVGQMRWTPATQISLLMATALSIGTAACKNNDATTEDSGVDTAALNEAPTWYQDVAPIVTPKCSGCHQEGGIAPFSMQSYESAKIFAKQMAEAVEAGRMPPFLAQDTDECKPRLPWEHDMRLSEDEKATLRAWADADAPKGDKSKAAKTKQPQQAKLEREDVVLNLPLEMEVDGTEDLHRCVVIDPGLDSDAIVTGSLITSGNTRVLHHVISYVVQPGRNDDGTDRTKSEVEAIIKEEKGVGIGEYYECFGGVAVQNLSFQIVNAWAPGSMPILSPKDSGMLLDKDSLIVLDMHYHPTGAGLEKDSKTKLAMMTINDVQPKYVSRIQFFGNFEGKEERSIGVGQLLKQKGEDTAEFMIPAGAKNHVEEMTWTFDFTNSTYGPIDLRIIGLGTHMHYVGRDMAVWLEHGDKSENPGDKECLIQTPAWDFNWQRGYTYDAPIEDLPVMGDSDTLRMRCIYDNSLDNKFVAQALDDQGLDKPRDVLLGEDTLDEMCIAAVGVMYPNINAGQRISAGSGRDTNNSASDAGVPDASTSDAGE